MLDKLAIALVDLDHESAVALRATFAPWYDKAEEWAVRATAIRVTDAAQVREMRLARESRLALREIRVNVEHARKELKAASLKRGHAIDGIANVIKGLIEPIEARLLEQETFVERQEESRRVALTEERVAALQALGVSLVPARLGDLSVEAWETMLETERMRIARETEFAREAALAQEKVRIEREQAEAKLRAENSRLKKEAAAREKVAQAEREKLEAARKAEHAKAARERKAKEDAERELATIKAAEEARLAEEEEARQTAEAAPDREKLLAFVAAIRNLERPSMTTAKGKAVLRELEEQLGAAMASAKAVIPRGRR